MITVFLFGGAFNILSDYFFCLFSLTKRGCMVDLQENGVNSVLKCL